MTLQELWVFADYEHVREAVSRKLSYSKFFYRYVSASDMPAVTDRLSLAVRWELAS